MRWKPVIGATVGVAILLAAGSIVYAAIPDSGGVVHTCFKAGGTWRLIDSASEPCKEQETEVDLYSKVGADNLFLTLTGKAADSDKLDGLDSTAFLPVTGKAADSDKLDGLDSTAYVQNGDAAGGDLTGTYPDPTIAQGSVDSGKVADHSLRLADIAVVDGTDVISAGTLTAHTCGVLGYVLPTGAQDGDLVMVFVDTRVGAGGAGKAVIIQNSVARAELAMPGQPPTTTVRWEICNPSDFAVDASALPIHYVVLR
jgi:hypothetical protein